MTKNPGSSVSPVTSIAYAPFRILIFSSHMFTASDYKFAFCSNLKLFLFFTKSHKYIAHISEVHGRIPTPPIDIDEFCVTYLNELDTVNMIHESFDFKDFMETYLIWADTHADSENWCL